LQKQFKAFCIVCTVTGRERPLSQHPVLPGTPAFYRQRAAELLQQAETAADEKGREQFLKLAEQWHRLATIVEEPSW